MFERFTDQARQVYVSAQEEARRAGNPFVGVEHLLVAMTLVDPGQTVASVALEELGLTAEVIRSGFTDPSATEDSRFPITPQAKKSLEYALREALQLRHNYIGTEHLLLGVSRSFSTKEQADWLASLGGPEVSPDQIRAKVIKLLGQDGAGNHLSAPQAGITVPQPGDKPARFIVRVEITTALTFITWGIQELRQAGDDDPDHPLRRMLDVFDFLELDQT